MEPVTSWSRARPGKAPPAARAGAARTQTIEHPVSAALEQDAPAARAAGVLELELRGVADVDVGQACLPSDVGRQAESLERRRRHVEHPVSREEAAHVPRRLRAELGRDPVGERPQLARVVVVTGDDQRRDLDPDTGCPVCAERVQHGRQARPAEAPVEGVVEGLEVDVRGVEDRRRGARSPPASRSRR